jgi:trehalose 6-phosphate phosphatase
MQVDCEALAQKIVRERRSLHLLKGKMVVEIKAARGDKGAAVEELMKLKPFEGRLPVFAGDDITDETAFKAVERRDGITIKVGDGETAARYRAGDIAQLHDWLSRQAAGGPPRQGGESLHKRAALS